jgi:hypothetical protein
MKQSSKFDAIFDRKRGDSTEGTSTVAEGEQTQVKRPGRPGGRGKSSNPNYTPVTVYIPKSIHDEARIALIREGKREFSALVEELLTQWIQQKQVS